MPMRNDLTRALRREVRVWVHALWIGGFLFLIL
jgi:hypothetical protein